MRVSFKAALCAAFCGAIFTVAPHARATPTYTVSNLDQSVAAYEDRPFIGQSILTGSSATTFDSFTISDPSAPADPKLEIEARNSDGTEGATLYTIDAADSSYSSGLLTFTAPTSFTLAANTGYWFVFSDPGVFVKWNYTLSSTYTSSSGFTVPSADDYSNGLGDNGATNYGSIVSGAYLFGLVTSPVAAPASPEPGTFAMAALALPALGFWAWKKRSRAAE